jgi:hypothetical protein
MTQKTSRTSFAEVLLCSAGLQELGEILVDTGYRFLVLLKGQVRFELAAIGLSLLLK